MNKISTWTALLAVSLSAACGTSSGAGAPGGALDGSAESSGSSASDGASSVNSSSDGPEEYRRRRRRHRVERQRRRHPHELHGLAHGNRRNVLVCHLLSRVRHLRDRDGGHQDADGILHRLRIPVLLRQHGSLPGRRPHVRDGNQSRRPGRPVDDGIPESHGAGDRGRAGSLGERRELSSRSGRRRPRGSTRALELDRRRGDDRLLVRGDAGHGTLRGAGVGDQRGARWHLRRAHLQLPGHRWGRRWGRRRGGRSLHPSHPRNADQHRDRSVFGHRPDDRRRRDAHGRDRNALRTGRGVPVGDVQHRVRVHRGGHPLSVVVFDHSVSQLRGLRAVVRLWALWAHRRRAATPS